MYSPLMQTQVRKVPTTIIILMRCSMNVTLPVLRYTQAGYTVPFLPAFKQRYFAKKSGKTQFMQRLLESLDIIETLILTDANAVLVPRLMMTYSDGITNISHQIIVDNSHQQ